MSDIYEAIMNIPCEPDTANHGERQAFKRGHKQARHGAAELIAAQEGSGEQASRIVIGWHVEFEDGSVELWKASDINGEPSFGRWVTPLIAGGAAIDLAPEQVAD